MTKENQMDDLMQPVHYMIAGNGKFGIYESGIHFDSFANTGYWESRGYESIPLYTADQMREYARQAVEAEREACALLVEENAQECSGPMGLVLQANADAIRARGQS